MSLSSEYAPGAHPGQCDERDALAALSDVPVIPPGLGRAWLIPQHSARIAVSLGVLAATLGVTVATLHPGVSGAGIKALASLIVAGGAWLAWVPVKRNGPALWIAMVAMGIAGGVAASVGPAGLMFVFVAAVGSATALELDGAIGLAFAGPIACVVAELAAGSFPGRLIDVCAVALLGVVSGTGRRQAFQRNRQQMLVAVADERARFADERAQVAAEQVALIAERNRLGREIHDVLAHTLGGLSIQLGAVDALADTGTDITVLREEIGQARGLLVEGLAEARQAVHALREDSVSLVEQLTRLCDRAHVSLQVLGTPRHTGAELNLALYRVCQEALTNAAKHAAGAPVHVQICFEERAVTVSAHNQAAQRAVDDWLGSSGGGYGLEGMRERVRLAGGQLQVGPADDGWRVTAAIPT